MGFLHRKRKFIPDFPGFVAENRRFVTKRGQRRAFSDRTAMAETGSSNILSSPANFKTSSPPDKTRLQRYWPHHIQPIVENAVRYGVERRKVDIGRVTWQA